VKPAPFEYRRAETLEEALDHLAEHGGEAKPLAGGQSLIPVLNMRLARPEVLVDINPIGGLDRIEEADGALRAGALVRQSAFERSPLVALRLPLVAEALPYVGHFVTRNRGTIGGTIAHADASAELCLTLLTLGGSVTLVSPSGRRTVPADEFFVTHYTTTIEPGELLVETLWPCAAPGQGFAFEELAQRRGDYALAMTACSLDVDDGRVQAARVGLGSVVERPTLVPEAAAALAGRAVDADVAREAGAAAAATVDPGGGIHASPEYLRHLVAVLVERAVGRAWRNALGGSAS